MTKVYLNIERDSYKKLEPAAVKLADEELDKEDKGTGAIFKDMSIDDPTIEFDNGEISVCGSLFKEGLDLGFLDVTFDLDLDLATDIVNYYMKKLGKLKTVLESTK